MPQANIPLINGVVHSWASIKVNYLGRTFTGITSIEYGNTRVKENLYGAGDQPVARGYGNKEPETVKLELYTFELDAMQAAAVQQGYKDITEIPPGEIVVNLSPTGSFGSVTHVIRNAEVLGNKRSWKQGDTAGKATIEVICSDVNYSG